MASQMAQKFPSLGGHWVIGRNDSDDVFQLLNALLEGIGKRLE